jgi:hypothetical protein
LTLSLNCQALYAGFNSSLWVHIVSIRILKDGFDQAAIEGQARLVCVPHRPQFPGTDDGVRRPSQFWELPGQMRSGAVLVPGTQQQARRLLKMKYRQYAALQTVP